MDHILNLTETAIVIISDQGVRKLILASGYVARVQTERRRVADYAWDTVSDASEVIPHPIPDKDDYNPRGFEDHTLFPIFEEIPLGIVVEKNGELFHIVEDSHLRPVLGIGDTLFIVSREVAEVAAFRHICSSQCPEYSEARVIQQRHCAQHGKRHPLSRHMVWPDDPVYGVGDSAYTTHPIGYRTLLRVPQ